MNSVSVNIVNVKCIFICTCSKSKLCLFQNSVIFFMNDNQNSMIFIFIFTNFKTFSWNSMIFSWSWNRSEFHRFFKWSLIPGRCGCNIIHLTEQILLILLRNLATCCEIAVNWMPKSLTIDKLLLNQVIAWCRQARSHYRSYVYPDLLSPYDFTATMS